MNKNLKRFLAVVMTVAILAAQLVVPSFAATKGYCNTCGTKGEYSDAGLLYTIEPTCKDGYAIYACEYVKVVTSGNVTKEYPCDGQITVRLGATAEHVSDDVLVEGWEAECLKDGQKDYETCTVCDKTLDPDTHEVIDIVIPQLGHDYEETVTDPECEKNGYTTYVCSRCGDTQKNMEEGDDVEKLGHTYTKVIEAKAATCRSEGWEEYTVCIRCGKENPEDPKVVLPIEDHNLHLVKDDSKTYPATCTAKGQNFFKCEKQTCPYYEGVAETLPKLGHDYVSHKAVAATCDEPGNEAYYTCSRCNWLNKSKTASATIPKPVIDAPGHTEVTVYIPATCREDGVVGKIICDRSGCDKVHHAGEVEKALGHEWGTEQQYVEALCETKGVVASVQCSVCELWFAEGTEADDIETDPLKTTEIAAIGHDYETIIVPAKCDEQGYTVKTCKRDNCDKKPLYTLSTPIAPTGHTLKAVEEVAPKCKTEGTKAHKVCTVEGCGKLFAPETSDTDNATATPIDRGTLVIEGLDHVEKVVEKVLPTYNDPGHEAGIICALCNESLFEAAKIDELDEAVKFYYEIAGVNGAKNAVNSGFVTLKVYFDVLTDEDDKEEYASDVLANLYAVDFAMNYDKDTFELVGVEVPGTFSKSEYTPLKDANKSGNVKIAQDMVHVTAGEPFRGEKNLFATLTFNVADDAEAGEYTFAKTELEVVHNPKYEDGDTAEKKADELSETVGLEADEAIAIVVKKLGDANGSGTFTSHDTLEISKYIKDQDLETEYVAEYDMDKDGDIDFIDLDLLRKAIVGNDEYLTIPE